MDLKGKTAVITGATSGIGRATALALAARGVEVLAVGRDEKRGAEVEAQLKAASGGSGSFFKADLSLLSEAKRLIHEAGARYPKLDALILSVGGVGFKPETTAEGKNAAFVREFLQKGVLLEGFRPLLAAGQGRAVLVAADLPDSKVPEWGNFEGAQVYAGLAALPNLHTASLSLIQAWAPAWQDQGVQLCAIHPGLVDTAFFRSTSGAWKILNLLLKLLSSPPSKPAGLLAHLAFAPEAFDSSGWFYPNPGNYKKRRKLARGPETLERVQKVFRAATSA